MISNQLFINPAGDTPRNVACAVNELIRWRETIIILPGIGTVTSVGASAAADILIGGTPITTSGTLTFALQNTTVVAGSYTYASITVDAKGRITSAANGSSPGTGDVVGPASANDNRIARFDGTTGKLIQNSGASIDDSGNITANNLSGTNTGDYTDEQAQDAVGAMVDASLVYVDGTPLLTRAALTGDVTASQGSNATTIANDAVTFAKFQNITDARLLGRSAGSAGDMQEITVGTGLSLSGGSLTNVGSGAVGAVVLITETTTTSSAASVTFSSIPTTWRDLEIRIRGRSLKAAVTTDTVAMTFNGDTGSHYTWEKAQAFSSGSSLVQSGGAVTSISLLEIPAASATTSHVGFVIVDIADYRGTTFFKCASYQLGVSLGTGTFTQGETVGSGQWLDTSAINSITLTPTTGFIDGTIVSLYGRY